MTSDNNPRSWIARLIGVDGDSIPCEIVGISDDILVVEFPREGDPVLQIAEQIGLLLQGGEDLTIDVRVVHRTESLASVQYRLVMIGTVRPDLGAVFLGPSRGGRRST